MATIVHIILFIVHYTSTLWFFNIAMENGPLIDGLPIKNGDLTHGEVSHNQRVDPAAAWKKSMDRLKLGDFQGGTASLSEGKQENI
jgi:hypothetical protein